MTSKGSNNQTQGTTTTTPSSNNNISYLLQNNSIEENKQYLLNATNSEIQQLASDWEKNYKQIQDNDDLGHKHYVQQLDEFNTEKDISKGHPDFLKYNSFFLDLDTEMFKRTLLNSDGYDQLPHYEKKGTQITYHPFTETSW